MVSVSCWWAFFPSPTFYYEQIGLNSVSDISLEVVLNIYYIRCLVDIRELFACIIQKLPQ